MSAGVKTVDIDESLPRDLFPGCRTCVYWESPNQFREKVAPEEAAKLKAAWFANMGTQPYGKLLYVDDEPAAYCQFAPPDRLPGIFGYEKLSFRLDREAAFISCLVVREGYQRRGLGRTLLQETIGDLRRRGYKAVATFARDNSDNNCSGPTKFYVEQGFSVVVSESFPDGTFSLVRLDLDS
ncbi:MAG: GNAT family N-acetyltransferase [Armatimonadota bacterium]|nr:GNAT family N-acetyltransferase [Armatimonadota bacterium]